MHRGSITMIMKRVSYMADYATGSAHGIPRIINREVAPDYARLLAEANESGEAVFDPVKRQYFRVSEFVLYASASARARDGSPLVF